MRVSYPMTHNFTSLHPWYPLHLCHLTPNTIGRRRHLPWFFGPLSHSTNTPGYPVNTSWHPLTSLSPSYTHLIHYPISSVCWRICYIILIFVNFTELGLSISVIFSMSHVLLIKGVLYSTFKGYQNIFPFLHLYES